MICLGDDKPSSVKFAVVISTGWISSPSSDLKCVPAWNVIGAGEPHRDSINESDEGYWKMFTTSKEAVAGVKGSGSVVLVTVEALEKLEKIVSERRGWKYFSSHSVLSLVLLSKLSNSTRLLDRS